MIATMPSSEPVSERSYAEMTQTDLIQVTKVALARLERVFREAPVAGLYRDRLLILTLCQGSALHYIDRKNGVKDIDVWAFFEAGPAQPFPFRTVWTADFGTSHHGRNPDDHGYVGRRLDLIGRSIICSPGGDPVASVGDWVRGGGSSPSQIGKRPVIGLHPANYLGQVVWMPE